MAATPKFKITYATMNADPDMLHREFDAAVKRVEALRGKTFPILINGKEVETGETLPVTSPLDIRRPFIYFAKASREYSKQAIAAAKAAFPKWKAVPWEERCKILDRVADKISDTIFDLSAMMSFEMGKNRLEALGDVEETADLLRYYAFQLREHKGFVRKMGSLSDNETNTDVLKPYGVWAVIAPFNFPLALAGGPVGAALVTGNTVVLKPSSDAPFTSYKLVEYFIEEGVPDGTINLVVGPGSSAGAELIENKDVSGITFTGSYDIGFKQVYQKFAPDHPKPVIVEMGGKNPTIVSDKADLEKAAQGVMRSAFGLGGQKCSACSRVYVHKSVYDAFLSTLVEKTSQIKIGDPTKDSSIYLGPLVNKSAYEDYKRFIDKARKDGKVVFGGNVVTSGEMQHGLYVEPAIITDLPQNHELVQNELFVPIVYVSKVDSLDEAMQRANDTVYGLTAGFFSEDAKEIQWFLDNIEAGVVYVNRAAGATTGAWPGYQPFGGWKSSGSSGRNIGGYYTLLNYLREQSQTVIR